MHSSGSGGRTHRLRSGRSPEIIVGRERERSVLHEGLTSLARGQSFFAIVAGEPGIGKSHLLRWAAHGARAMSADVHWSAPQNGTLPLFHPFRSVLSSCLKSVGEAPDDSSAARVQAQELRRVLDPVPASGTVPRSAGSSSSERVVQLIGVATSVIRRAAAVSPRVIIIEDLHRTMAGGLAFVRALTTVNPVPGLGVVASVRENEVNAEVREEYDRLVAGVALVPSAHFFELEPLDVSDALALYRAVREDESGGTQSTSVLPGSTIAAAGGNPLFIVELARSGQFSGCDEAIRSEPPVLPRTIQAMTSDRLRCLPRLAREIVEMAAVLGERFQWSTIRALFREVDELTLAQALDGLVSARLIEEDEDASLGFRFHHGLVRAAILCRFSRTRLAAEHFRVATHLASHGFESTVDERNRVITIWNHLIKAGGMADPGMLFCSARDTALAYLGHYEPSRAREVVRETVSHATLAPCKQAELFLISGMAAVEEEDGPGACDALTRSFDLFLQSGMVSRAIEVALTPALEYLDVGFTQHWIWANRGLPALRERALRLVPEGSREHSMLLCQADERGERLHALEMAENRDNDPVLQLHVTMQLARFDYLNLDLDSAETLIMRAGELCDRVNDREQKTLQLSTRVGLCMMSGARRRDCLAAIEELHQHAERVGSLATYHEARLRMANLHAHCGEWGQARTLCEELLSAWQPSEERTSLEYDCMRTLLHVELETGHDEEARTLLERLAPGSRSWYRLLRTAYLTGDAEPLRDRKQLASTAQNVHAPWHFDGYHLFLDGRTAILLGDRPEVERWLRQVSRWPRLFGHEVSPFISGTAIGLQGELLRSLGRLDESVALLEQADARCLQADRPLFRAWNLVELSAALCERGRPGDRDRALSAAEEAVSVCHSLDLVGVGRRARELRSGLAQPPQVRPYGAQAQMDATCDGRLSRRELEVLRLIARGYTNREIGDRLCISRHTAARHVHSILEKTGMANRAEVTAYAIRNGLLPDA